MTPKMKFLRHLVNTITDLEKGNPRLCRGLSMELENRDFRATMYNDMKRGLQYMYYESHKTLCEFFWSIALGKATISKWFREFGFDRSNVKDYSRCGRPVSAATQQNATRAKELIMKDPQMTCRDVKDMLGIGMSAFIDILHHQLGVHRRCAKWVPYQRTEELKGGRVQWCLTMHEKYDG